MRHEGFLFTLQVSAPPVLRREEVGCFIPQQIDALLITPLLQAPADQVIDHLGYMDGAELAGGSLSSKSQLCAWPDGISMISAL